jgi:hypothetical protein
VALLGAGATRPRLGRFAKALQVVDLARAGPQPLASGRMP